MTILLFAQAAMAGDSSPVYSRIDAVSLNIPGAGRQIIQADKEGRVFLLRGAPLDLYQISSDGTAVPKGRLVREGSSKTRAPVRDAAMSLDGGTWVLLTHPNLLDVVRNGRQERVEVPWMVTAVALPGGDPVTAVLPAEMGTTSPESLRLESPPLLQEWNGKSWNTLSEGRFPGQRPEGVTRPEYLRGEFSVLLAPTREGHLWVADEHVYRLRRFSPSGVLKDELVVGKPEITWGKRSAEEWEKAEKAAMQAGISFGPGALSSVRAEQRVLGLTAGRDGAVYLLVRSKDGLALDRFHPMLLTLDRLILSGIDAGLSRVTMAAGQGGLYLAAPGPSGVWFIDSEVLDQADWSPVEETLLLNGQSLILPKAEPEAGAPKQGRP